MNASPTGLYNAAAVDKLLINNADAPRAISELCTQFESVTSWDAATLEQAVDARTFAAKYGLRYPLLRDGDGRTLKDFEVAGQPWTFVIGRDGRITAVRRGPVDERFMRDEVLPLTRRAS